MDSHTCSEIFSSIVYMVPEVDIRLFSGETLWELSDVLILPTFSSFFSILGVLSLLSCGPQNNCLSVLARGGCCSTSWLGAKAGGRLFHNFNNRVPPFLSNTWMTENLAAYILLGMKSLGFDWLAWIPLSLCQKSQLVPSGTLGHGWSKWINALKISRASALESLMVFLRKMTKPFIITICDNCWFGYFKAVLILLLLWCSCWLRHSCESQRHLMHKERSGYKD